MSKTLSFTVGDSMRIAYQRWGQGNPKKALCFHGWLDNSNSFGYLGPLLADKFGFDVVAIDHPGHGRSSHFHQLTAYPVFSSFAFPIQESLGWSKSHVIGHSMGANMSLVFAGCFPERVEKLVLIEGIGPPSGNVDSVVKNFRKAVVAEHEMNKKAAAGKTRKIYKTLQEAIKSRVSVVTTYPGSQYISHEAASTIIARAAVRAKATHSNEYAGDFDLNELDVHDPNLGPVRLHYDPKLVLPTLMQFTEEEVEMFIKGIQSPTLYVSSDKGWPLLKVVERKKAFQPGMLQHVHLPGSHHLHLDPPDAPRCAEVVSNFLLAEPPSVLAGPSTVKEPTFG